MKLLFRSLPILAALLLPAVAEAADCARSDALGTSRVMTVDPASTPRVGLKHFAQTLPLADKEVVLTFDDGPLPPMTARVLDTLKAECVRATFFLIGRNARANPALVKRMAADGHTIAHHTWSHRILNTISDGSANQEIGKGIAAVEDALHGRSTETPSTPFFRFPGFASNRVLLDQLEKRGIVVFGADLWASDWNVMTPEQELQQITSRVQHARRGIILMHDIRGQTVAMLPAFLRWLKTNGYKIVHVTPRGNATAALGPL
jgi:peptidoglycan/xylan/chitin deacetylase (PgdA/CDA1 family)